MFSSFRSWSLAFFAWICTFGFGLWLLRPEFWQVGAQIDLVSELAVNLAVGAWIGIFFLAVGGPRVNTNPGS